VGWLANLVEPPGGDGAGPIDLRTGDYLAELTMLPQL
jgi:hypothetical protein